MGKEFAWLEELVGNDLVLDLLTLHEIDNLTVEIVDQKLDLFRNQPNVLLRQFGYSTYGHPIRGLVMGKHTASQTALIYGYPHPEEPLGANVCFELAQIILKTTKLQDSWRIILIPCADPDMAQLNKNWICNDTLMDFVVGSFRPMQIEREVDYGFPVDHPKIYHPDDFDIVNKCYYAGQCVQEDFCGPLCRRFFEPAGPLAESLVIANTIRDEKPDLIIALHNSAIGGSYDFTSWKPSSKFVNALDEIANLTGQPRHLGERIDVAKPHFKNRGDILMEPLLESDIKELEQYHGELQDGETFAGNVSMAQFVESSLPNTKVFMPEAMHFSSAQFGDTAPSTITRNVEVMGENCFGYTVLPNNKRIKVDYGSKLAKKLGEGKHKLTITQGMLGVEMVAMRNWINNELQLAWDSLPEEVQAFDHPIAAELRCGAAKPGYERHIKDDQFKQELVPATKADEAMFFYRFKLILANRIGLIQRLLVLSNADEPDLLTHLQALIEQMIKGYPPELQRASSRVAGVHSQLLRTLLALAIE